MLIVDTSGLFAVLALANQETGTIRTSSVFESRRLLSRRLLGQIDALLQSEGMALEDVSAFAVGLGPGSFTGVRVGVTTMKTLAQVTGKSLVGVGTLDAYGSLWQGNTPVVPVLPSRRGECYTATYQNGLCVEGPHALAYDALAASLAHMPQAVVCGDAPMISATLEGMWSGVIQHQPSVPPEGLARLATVRLRDGDTDDPLALTPLYIVSPTITTPKNPQVLAGTETQNG